MYVLMSCWRLRDVQTPAMLQIPLNHKGMKYIIKKTAGDTFNIAEAFHYHMNNKLPLHQKFFYSTSDGSILDAHGKMKFTFNYFTTKRFIVRFV